MTELPWALLIIIAITGHNDVMTTDRYADKESCERAKPAILETLRSLPKDRKVIYAECAQIGPPSALIYLT